MPVIILKEKGEKEKTEGEKKRNVAVPVSPFLDFVNRTKGNLFSSIPSIN
jgi:hypothetical protein